MKLKDFTIFALLIKNKIFKLIRKRVKKLKHFSAEEIKFK